MNHLGIFCLIGVPSHTWHSELCQIVYATNVIYVEHLFLYTWAWAMLYHLDLWRDGRLSS